MSEIKLLPCPFCGGEAELEKITVVYNHDNARTDVYVRCKVCGAESGDCVNNEVDAINKWNTRKPLQEIVERLEEIKKIMLSPKNVDCFGEPCTENDCMACVINKAIEIVKEVGGMND